MIPDRQWRREVLPAPVGPSIAQQVPPAIFNEREESTLGDDGEYWSEKDDSAIRSAIVQSSMRGSRRQAKEREGSTSPYGTFAVRSVETVEVYGETREAQVQFHVLCFQRSTKGQAEKRWRTTLSSGKSFLNQPALHEPAEQGRSDEFCPAADQENEASAEA